MDKLAETAIGQIEKIFGTHPSFRRAHARGKSYRARFTATGLAGHLTTASHFQEGEIAAFVRFSHFSPDPTWADAMSPVKGMAVQFQLPNGEVTNIVGVTSPIFFARTPEIFTEMLGVVKSFKKGKPSLTELADLLADYPESGAMIANIRKMQAPSSFATGQYNSVHAFYFINQERQRQPVKYLWEPESGTETLSLLDAIALPIGFFETDMEDRIAKGPVMFRLNVILGQPGDPTDDPTKEWPENREKLTLGYLTITEKAPEVEKIMFDPTLVTEGIECSEDQILNFRHHAYKISHDRRISEI
ncbi:catalase-like protein [Planococcus antarcticus DSM 14505]|uniref:Catalase n=1 Tax=Planococcus antarcticus DSM 14505 TaxID=1185653 RepID=A0A1C7DCN8_9BACL|nr:catalase family peroxidase [Planococcus antarcticus]ANU09033.1 catalase [Planococcus antarcticus DSM 14505]EIM07283.1 catalase-like protein [Planococcus antarcticus DSM 14505]